MNQSLKSESFNWIIYKIMLWSFRRLAVLSVRLTDLRDHFGKNKKIVINQ